MITNIERITAQTVHGAIMHWVQYGDKIERDGEEITIDAKTKPTLEEARALGKCLGQVYQWKWNATYKTLTRKGVHPVTQRHTPVDFKILQSVKPTFSTQDFNKEAAMLEYGITEMPGTGEKVVPFTNASGALEGWLFIEVVDSYRTTGSDYRLAVITMPGSLSLQDTGDNVDDLKDVPFEFSITDASACEFENVGYDLK